MARAEQMRVCRPGRSRTARSRSDVARRQPLAAVAIGAAIVAATRLARHGTPAVLQLQSHMPIFQPTVDYWCSCARDWSTRLGVPSVFDEALPEPVVTLLNSTRLSDEEKQRLQRQREDYYHDDSIRSVRITLYASVPVFALSLLGFEFMLRRRPTSVWRKLCVPRLVVAETSSGRLGANPASGGEAFEEDRQPDRQVWCRTAELMRTLLMMDDKEVLEAAGMDALVLLRFCALCGRFCAILCLWCLLLSPLYANGGNWWIIGPRQGLTRYTLANLRQGSMLLWSAVPAAYLCTLTLCSLLRMEYERFVLLRRSFLGGGCVPAAPAPTANDDGEPSPCRRNATATPPPNDFWLRNVTPNRDQWAVGSDACEPSPAGAEVCEQTRRTVLVEGLPQELSDPSALRAYLEEMLGGSVVHSIAPVPADSRRLCELLDLRDQLAEDRGGNWQELARIEETLRARREVYGRSVIASATKTRLKGTSYANPRDSGSFVSVAGDAAEENPYGSEGLSRAWNLLPFGAATTGTVCYTQPVSHQGQTSRRRSACVSPPVGLSRLCAAAGVAVRVAVSAVFSAGSAIRTMVAELVGTSMMRVGQLVPVSALGTPGQSHLNTPGPSAAIGTPPALYDPPFFDYLVPSSAPPNRRRFSSAFVTFKNLQSACVACQVTLEDAMFSNSELTVTPAPEPRDVVWRNASRPATQRLMRSFFVESALFFGLAFWSVPVSLLQAWCSWARLQKLLPWMQLTQQFVKSDVYALLTLYLPVIILLLILELLPLILHWLAKYYEGLQSHSALQMLTMRRYWRFQLATIFVTVLSGSVLDSLKTIVDHPPSFLWQLGQSLPKVAVYFLATVLSSALVVAPVSLLRLPTLAKTVTNGVIRLVRRCGAALLGRGRFDCRISDDSADVEAYIEAPDLAADMSALLFVLLVCVTYATIAPFIMLPGLLFFVVKWQALAVRYLYVCSPRFDSGGAFWYLLWDQALLALVLGNLTTLALVAMLSGYGQLPFLLPLPAIPIGFKLRAEQRFAEASKRLSLRSGRLLDAQNPRVSDRLCHDAYWHPALRIAEGDQRAGGYADRDGIGSIKLPGAAVGGPKTMRRELAALVHARVLDAVEEAHLGLESSCSGLVSRCVSATEAPLRCLGSAELSSPEVRFEDDVFEIPIEACLRKDLVHS